MIFRYLPVALSQRNAQAEQSGSELRVAVQIKQNSPASNVTVLELAVKELPPLVPLHSYVGLSPTAEHVNSSPASYSEPAIGVMLTEGGHSTVHTKLCSYYKLTPG